MKKVLRIFLILVGFIVVGILGFIGFVAIRGIPTYDPPVVQEIKIEATPARLIRGEKIAQMLCIQCHADNENKLTGKYLADVPPAFGKLYSVNITQDKELGIGAWTNAELEYFLRTGVRKDGSFAPIMPKFPSMADEDVKSVIAWLRSDAFPVQATHREALVSEYSLLAKVLANTVIKALPYSPTVKTIPDSTNEVAFGRYVANEMVACFVCHSADLKQQNPLHPELTPGFYGGGNEMSDLDGKLIFTANLTFDATGIGGNKYTKEQFVKALKYGVRPDGSVLRYPMVPHSPLTDYEAGAIYEYLKTVPKISNDVTKKEQEALASN